LHPDEKSRAARRYRGRAGFPEALSYHGGSAARRSGGPAPDDPAIRRMDRTSGRPRFFVP